MVQLQDILKSTARTVTGLALLVSMTATGCDPISGLGLGPTPVPEQVPGAPPGVRYNRPVVVRNDINPKNMCDGCYGPFAWDGGQVNYSEEGFYLLDIDTRNLNSYKPNTKKADPLPAHQTYYVTLGYEISKPGAYEFSMRLIDLDHKVASGNYHTGESGPPLSPNTSKGPSADTGNFGRVFVIYSQEKDLGPGRYVIEILVNGNLVCGAPFTLQ